jgi:amino acid permease
MLCRSKVLLETVRNMKHLPKLSRLIKLSVLPYKSPLQPYVAYVTTFIVFLIIFFSGKCAIF